MRRYPLQELVEASGLSEAEFGRRVGLSGSSLTKARRDGLIESAADRYACRAGLVPWLVWSDWLEDLKKECAAEDCSAQFIPARTGHAYCSKRCRERVGSKRRYHTDPAARARAIASAAGYYDEAGDYRRTQMRRRHWENRDAELDRMRAYYAANRERLQERDRQRKADARRAKNKDATGNNRQNEWKDLTSLDVMYGLRETEWQCPETGLIYELRPDSSQVACGSVAA